MIPRHRLAEFVDRDHFAAAHATHQRIHFARGWNRARAASPARRELFADSDNLRQILVVGEFVAPRFSGGGADNARHACWFGFHEREGAAAAGGLDRPDGPTTVGGVKPKR